MEKPYSAQPQAWCASLTVEHIAIMVKEIANLSLNPVTNI